MLNWATIFFTFADNPLCLILPIITSFSVCCPFHFLAVVSAFVSAKMTPTGAHGLRSRCCYCCCNCRRRRLLLLLLCYLPLSINDSIWDDEVFSFFEESHGIAARDARGAETTVDRIEARRSKRVPIWLSFSGLFYTPHLLLDIVITAESLLEYDY